MFRVVADQLKLRGGLVRCGSCRHVFDAIGSLSYIDEAGLGGESADPDTRSTAPAARGSDDEASAASTPPTGSVSSAASGSASGSASGPATRPHTLRIEPAPLRLPDVPQTGGATSAGSTIPMHQATEAGPPTLFAPGVADAARAASGEVRQETEAERRARRERRRRRREAMAGAQAVKDVAPAEPAFLRDEGREARGFSVVFGGGSVLLLALLLAQLAIVLRSELLIRFPGLRPAIVQLCDVAGCSVGWPTRAELLAVVGSELQAVPGTDILELTAIVRNRAVFKVALPALEVTLTDVGNRVLARKVFAPVDYLASAGEPSSRIDEGIGAGSDYTIRIHFEARGLSAAGFVVYPFYL
jgi:predicted Zn finger-like uncharacterized protein